MVSKKTNPNRLFKVLILISFGIHVLLFIHVSKVYQSHAVSYIELTIQDISKPYTRSIPRPRARLKNSKITDVERVKIQKSHIPKLDIEPIDTQFKDTLMEDISIPDISNNFAISSDQWNPMDEITFTTPNDYYETVRQKIESCKRYPDSAKSRYIEGRTKVRFVILLDGQVSSVKIIKGARHDILNMAAMNAVKAAAPLPRPPANLFKGPLHVELTIVFELM